MKEAKPEMNTKQSLAINCIKMDWYTESVNQTKCLIN